MIICTFNRAGLLPRALDSLQAQSESNWEAIIVDDASTDDTFDVVQRYAAADPRFAYLMRDQNLGVSSARNAGIAIARGEYVTFLDSDDEYAADHLALRMPVLLEGTVQLMHGGVQVIGDPFVIDRHDTSRLIHLDDCIVGGTFFIHRSVFDVVGGFDLVSYADDALFYEKCTLAGIRTMTVQYPTYIYYRNVPDQLTSKHGR